MHRATCTPLNMGSKAFAFSSCSLESPKFFRASQSTLSGSITYFFVRLLRCLCRCFLLRLLYLLLCLVRLFVLHFLFLCFGCRMVEVVLDYRCNLGKFNFRNFEEVETGRVLQLVHHVGKEVGTEIAVTVEFQKFAVFLRRYGLEFPVFIHAFHCADCLFLLIQYKKNIHHLFVSGGLAGCVYIHNFLNFSE